VSVLTGFAQTAAAARSAPVSIPLPQLATMARKRRGAPRLNPAIPALTPEQAAAIISADQSGAIVAPAGQPLALFVDLAVFSPSAALEALTDAGGEPLLVFDDSWPEALGRREDFVVPLRREARA
jgi:hypothetical protein